MPKFEAPEQIFPDLPEEVREVLLTAPEVEYATLTKARVPVNNPLFHYFRKGGKTIDVATGVAYPAKAERARRHPKVGLLFAPGLADQDPLLGDTSASEKDSPVVLVYAMAAVRDSDIQANTDRYVKEWLRHHADMVELPWDEEQKRVWYYARIWVECQPIKILWWPKGLSSGEKPREWLAPESMHIVESDPAPTAPPARPKKWPAPDWREAARSVVQNIPRPTLTLVDGDDFPLPFPTTGAKAVDEGFELELPAVLPWHPEGAACLTFSLVATFLGTVSQSGGRTLFTVDKLIGNLPLSSNDQLPEELAAANDELRKSLHTELERRGQDLPVVRKS